jgi:NADPH:quinone reductase-like Zn-dependent oxidoreductase
LLIQQIAERRENCVPRFGAAVSTINPCLAVSDTSSDTESWTFPDDDISTRSSQQSSCKDLNRTLVDAGFGGIDHELRHVLHPDGPEIITSISTVVDPEHQDFKFLVIEIITGEQSSAHEQFALQLQQTFSSQGALECSVRSLAHFVADTSHVKPYRILLTDFDQPFLSGLDPSSFEDLKRLITESEQVLWVSAGDADGESPEARMVDGFSRVLRNELGYLQLTTLILDASESTGDINIDSVIKVFKSKLYSFGSECEPEYEVKDGTLHIRRVLHDRSLTARVRGEEVSEEPRFHPFKSAGPLKMTVETPGFLDSLIFEEDREITGNLGSHDVEVKVAFTGLNFRDCLVALGQIDADRIGGECSGIVTRIGDKVTGVQISDRVAVLAPISTFKTFVQCHESYVSRIPDCITLAEASAIPVVYTTAHYAFVEVARAQASDSVLIHLGSGGTGQAAIQLAMHLGVSQVFTTVGSQEKKQSLIDTYGIPEDNIFSSRTDEFANAIMRKTNGRGVDIILNSLPGELMRASWGCIAPFGRFIEIGKRDVFERSSLSMGPFGANASFAVVDLGLLLQERPSLGHRSLRAVFNLLAAGYLTAPKPLKVYGVAETEAAFRHLQSRKSIGKMVIEMRPNDLVRVSLILSVSLLLCRWQ